MNSTFETRNRSRFFAPFPRLYLEEAIYVTFSNEFQLNSKSALYLSASIFQDFFLRKKNKKNMQDLYKSSLYFTFITV